MSPTLRICLFTPTFLPNIGGTELAVDAMARGFQRCGAHIVVLAPGPPVSLDVPYPVEWYARPPLPRAFPERVGTALARLHRRERFNLFVTKYAHPTGYAALRLGRRVDVPTVVISQGGDLYRSSRDRQRPHLWKRTLYTYRNANGLVAISPYIEELIREINPKPYLLDAIPNGVDVEAINEPAKRPADFTLDRPFCMCLGNLGPMKGFGDAIRGYAQARKQLGLMAMVIVGDGPLESALRKQSRELQVDQDVVFVGRRVGNDKRWFLQHCQFGVAPSLEEGHALVSLEFIAAGKALLCTTNPSFNGTCEDGVNGIRVKPGDVQAIGASLERLGKADLEAMGTASRKIARQFDWSNVVQRYLRFFHRVLEKSRASRV